MIALAAWSGINAQNESSQPAAASPFASDYPLNQPGIFIRSSTWKPITNQFPAKTKIAHSIAASLSYGLAPAKVVAEYQGEHAMTQADAGQVTICICHIVSLPGEPVIVRLHAKKGSRELDGGRMTIYPLVGGSRMADADKSDWIPTERQQPDSQVWLVRSQFPLPPGEYALMLGTQNLNIYPFTVAEPADAPSDAKRNP